MPDCQNKIDITPDVVKGLAVHSSEKPERHVFALVFPRALDVNWPPADEKDRKLKDELDKASSPTSMMRARIHSWQIQDAVPLILFFAWLAGVASTALLGGTIPGGILVAFLVGFAPVFFLLLLLWPESREG